MGIDKQIKIPITLSQNL